MKLHERLQKIESEIRVLCDKLKDDPNITKNLIKELRQNGYLSLGEWQQNHHYTDILAWKYGMAAAIRFRDGEEYVELLTDDLNAVVHQTQPEREILRFIIDVFLVSTPDETIKASQQTCIIIKPGDLKPSNETTNQEGNQNTEEEAVPF